MSGGERRSGLAGGLSWRIRNRLEILRSLDGPWARGTLEAAYVIVILAVVDVSLDGRLFVLEAAGLDFTLTDASLSVVIPPDVYLYALLGAGVYVATSLVFEPKDSVGEIKRLGYRLLAALPLGAGVFLFASVILGGDAMGISIDEGSGETVALDANTSAAGLAFLGGLFIRLTLKKLGDIAESISNVGQAGRLHRKEAQARLETTEAVRDAWRTSAGAEDWARSLDPEAHEKLRRAETLLESEDASVTQLERAAELAEEARTAFGRTADATASG